MPPALCPQLSPSLRFLLCFLSVDPSLLSRLFPWYADSLKLASIGRKARPFHGFNARFRFLSLATLPLVLMPASSSPLFAPSFGLLLGSRGLPLSRSAFLLLSFLLPLVRVSLSAHCQFHARPAPPSPPRFRPRSSPSCPFSSSRSPSSPFPCAASASALSYHIPLPLRRGRTSLLPSSLGFSLASSIGGPRQHRPAGEAPFCPARAAARVPLCALSPCRVSEKDARVSCSANPPAVRFPLVCGSTTRASSWTVSHPLRLPIRPERSAVRPEGGAHLASLSSSFFALAPARARAFRESRRGKENTDAPLASFSPTKSCDQTSLGGLKRAAKTTTKLDRLGASQKEERGKRGLGERTRQSGTFTRQTEGPLADLSFLLRFCSVCPSSADSSSLRSHRSAPPVSSLPGAASSFRLESSHTASQAPLAAWRCLYTVLEKEARRRQKGESGRVFFLFQEIDDEVSHRLAARLLFSDRRRNRRTNREASKAWESSRLHHPLPASPLPHPASLSLPANALPSSSASSSSSSDFSSASLSSCSSPCSEDAWRKCLQGGSHGRLQAPGEDCTSSPFSLSSDRCARGSSSPVGGPIALNSEPNGETVQDGQAEEEAEGGEKEREEGEEESVDEQPFVLFLNSPGGSLNAGLALFDVISVSCFGKQAGEIVEDSGKFSQTAGGAWREHDEAFDGGRVWFFRENTGGKTQKGGAETNRMARPENGKWKDMDRRKEVYLRHAVERQLVKKRLESPVYTVNMGLAASVASLILGAGTPGHRFAVESSSALLHQPAGSLAGLPSDLETEKSEVKKISQRVVRLYSQVTGRPEASLRLDIEKEKLLTAEEARVYGLVDAVLPLFDGAEKLL
uniref:ATP-dependent Clp protease proteolytic subunit n=1 Tax=Neospora caninum (strain Liverpool) TaxID=572307 RepID=A0A0F7UBG1_NEOCL|nr:TPA: ATP-dependent Clp protease proteolytic subunit 2 [Neospora caninum Liverpool]